MNSFKTTTAAIATFLAVAVATATTSLPAHAADLAQADAKTALWVVLDARPGKEDEVAKFLLGGRALVLDEPRTIAWYAVRLSKSRFAIFDTFPDDAGRDAHLGGKVAAALVAKSPELLQHAPSIEKIDVLAAK